MRREIKKRSLLGLFGNLGGVCLFVCFGLNRKLRGGKSERVIIGGGAAGYLNRRVEIEIILFYFF